jgi:hypothetical protein
VGQFVVLPLCLAAVQVGVDGQSAGQASRTIADVGERAMTLQKGELAFQIYIYEGLAVSGELLVRDYREALAVARSVARPDENLNEMLTHPDPKDRDFGVLTVETSFMSDRYRHRVIYLQKSEGRFRVVGIGGWIE